MNERHDIDEAALDTLIRQAFQRDPGEAPPPDFADRLMAGRGQSGPVPARAARRWRWPAVAVAAAALVALVFGRGGHAPDADHQATARQSILLDDRGIAVMEADSILEKRGGRWAQRAGDVFYRIDRGGAFRLLTPAGEVVVLGTCFRVEVDPMKLMPQTKIGFVAGAALAATVVVTVYEGRVRLANGSGQRDLEAGEQGSFAPGQAPRAVSANGAGAAARPGSARPPALLTASPPGEVEELRAKLAAQEKELLALRQDQKAKKGSMGPWVDVPQDELMARAGRCELKWEALDINGYEAKTIDEKNGWAKTAGLSDTERDAYNEALKDLQSSVLVRLRPLFVEMTGDAPMAEKLPVGGLIGLMMEKVPDTAKNEARAHLARERAGLQPPPADLARTPVIERALRIMTTVGDELEKKLGERLGSERARALRRVRDGWPGGRSSMSGCPN
ncbi:MAG TPA: hypothetical protein VN914_01530 [Polyangia bacterium]|nr:hypothetical protein [Polyangia bacterium]